MLDVSVRSILLLLVYLLYRQGLQLTGVDDDGSRINIASIIGEYTSITGWPRQILAI